jgi:hypothetical protein
MRNGLHSMPMMNSSTLQTTQTLSRDLCTRGSAKHGIFGSILTWQSASPC